MKVTIEFQVPTPTSVPPQFEVISVLSACIEGLSVPKPSSKLPLESPILDASGNKVGSINISND